MYDGFGAAATIGGTVASVEEHYESLLARHYTWMRGDYRSRVAEYRDFFEGARILPRSGKKALDLGAGSGLQSAALAALGFEVLAVDTNEALLGELSDRLGGRRVRPVPGDMRDPGAYRAEGPFEVAVCMGDTLSHLSSLREVEALVGDVCGSLETDGTLVLELRDYATELRGADRAIPVRMEDDRIMATFLEYEADRVNVHDMVFEKGTDGWAMHKSAYAKLRLGVGEVLCLLERSGLRTVSRGEDRGFTRIVART